MPNWCGNILTIQGDPATLDILAEAVRGKDSDGKVLVFSLEAIAPTPAALMHRAGNDFSPEQSMQLRERLAGVDPEIAKPYLDVAERAESNYPDPEHDALMAEYGADGWYNWRVKHWNTKWDVNDAESRHDPAHDDVLRYRFNTAWSPPKRVIEMLSHRFEALFFHLCYEEPGTNIAGFVAYLAGKQVAWSEGSWKSAITSAYTFRRELVGLLRSEDEDDQIGDVLSVLYHDW